MVIQILSIAGILILSYGFICEYRKRLKLQEQVKELETTKNDAI